MRFSAARSGRSALWSLLTFLAYVAALWAIAYYNLHDYQGAYNTIVTDILLSLAFAAAFFPPMLAPRCNKRKLALLVIALLCLAVVSFFALRPQYTVNDGYQILSDAHYEQIQLEDAYVPQAQNDPSHPFVSSSIVFKAKQGADFYEILFDPTSGSYYAMA